CFPRRFELPLPRARIDCRSNYIRTQSWSKDEHSTLEFEWVPGRARNPHSYTRNDSRPGASMADFAGGPRLTRGRIQLLLEIIDRLLGVRDQTPHLGYPLAGQVGGHALEPCDVILGQGNELAALLAGEFHAAL